jgi:hypothetical protein
VPVGKERRGAGTDLSATPSPKILIHDGIFRSVPPYQSNVPAPMKKFSHCCTNNSPLVLNGLSTWFFAGCRAGTDGATAGRAAHSRSGNETLHSDRTLTPQVVEGSTHGEYD